MIDIFSGRYLEKRVGGLASGSRPDQNMTTLRPRGLKLVILEQQLGEFNFHLDQAAGARVEIGRGRSGTHGVDNTTATHLRDLQNTLINAAMQADKRLVKVVGKRVGACLRHWRNKGVVRSIQGPGQYQL